MTEKDIIRCKNCAKAMRDIGIGFTAETILMCSERGMSVEADDGCTFGVIGKGGYVVNEHDVSLYGDAAVGCSDYYVE